MIKGITLVSAVASAGKPGAELHAEPGNEFDRLTSLFTALGFEQGKGWQDAQGRGAAFLAPLGNIEVVTGRSPSVPPILVETTNLDSIHAAVHQWLLASYRTEEIEALLSAPELTHWNSRLFTVQLTQDLKLGFWQSENPLHNQPDAVEGDLSAVNMRFAIVTTRWNTVITDRLLQGSLDALHRSGAARTDIEIVRVPGAWEVPSAARTLAESKKFDAIVTLGCLLRGETAHYEAIYNEVARGIGQSQQETGVPHAFGVLTCETLEQALDRAGLKAGNKGFEAAIAAVEMVSIQRKLAVGKEAPADAQQVKQ
jgi:6,7-dimethyl-8-ribityllumazine synthase